MQTSNEDRMSRSGRPQALVWWLIVQDENDRLEPLTVTCAGEQALPVFSFEEEAEIFHRLAALGSRWRARPSGRGELVSVLCGPCAQARRVVLDPLPEMLVDGTIELVSLDRCRFVSRLMGQVKGRFARGPTMAAGQHKTDA
jgi:hypothetical protein